MAHSESRSGQRAEVAPPRDSGSRAKRSGYLVLTISGVVLATVFGGLAELATSQSAGGSIPAGNSNSSSEVVTGTNVPGSTSVEDEPTEDSSAPPTTMTSVGPDGHTTLKVLPPAGPTGIRTSAGAPVPPGSHVTVPNPTTDSNPPVGSTSSSTTTTTPPTSHSTTPTTPTPPTTT